MLNLCDKLISLQKKCGHLKYHNSGSQIFYNFYNVGFNEHTMQVSELSEVASVFNIAQQWVIISAIRTRLVFFLWL